MKYSVSYFENNSVRKHYFNASNHDLALAFGHRFCKVYNFDFVSLNVENVP